MRDDCFDSAVSVLFLRFIDVNTIVTPKGCDELVPNHRIGFVPYGNVAIDEVIQLVSGRVRLVEHVVKLDTAILSQEEEIKTHRRDLTARGWDHLPVEFGDMVMPDDVGACSEDIATVAHPLFVGLAHAGFDGVVSAGIQQAMTCRAIFCPEFPDTLASDRCVRFIPYCYVLINDGCKVA